eukprot:COSAG05_NODE_1481_length_4761_cov_4.755684_2_plen_97_part_00
MCLRSKSKDSTTCRLILLARYIASRKAQEAVAGSAVKLTGTDVMATYKLLTWILMAPVMTVFYGVVAAYVFDVNIGLITALVLPALGQQAIQAQDK